MNISFETDLDDSDFVPQPFLAKKPKSQKQILYKGFVDKKSSEQEVEVQKTSYRWQTEQHAKYVRFLNERRDLFEMPLQKKITLGIHNLMSKYIKNRSARQCRSHHQKMMSKYKSIENILSQNAHLLVKINSEVATASQEEVFQKKEELQIGQDHLLESFFDIVVFPQAQRFCEYNKSGLIQIQSYQYDESFGLDLS